MLADAIVARETIRRLTEHTPCELDTTGVLSLAIVVSAEMEEAINPGLMTERTVVAANDAPLTVETGRFTSRTLITEDDILAQATDGLIASLAVIEDELALDAVTPAGLITNRAVTPAELLEEVIICGLSFKAIMAPDEEAPTRPGRMTCRKITAFVLDDIATCMGLTLARESHEKIVESHRVVASSQLGI